MTAQEHNSRLRSSNEHSEEPSFAVGLMALLVIAFVASLSIYRLSPPDAVPASAPESEFSSARAMRHLGTIAQKAHPIGSSQHNAVREYIVEQLAALGLDPSVQKATVVARGRSLLFTAGTVENIQARISGSDNKSATLIAAHYDSMPNAPGASDDGSGVAAILETARALKASPPLRNDVVFLLTDGEEAGLLGAKAFVESSPWSGDVALALNFEARGSRGPTLMFETSDGNNRLIEGYAESAYKPITNSLMYEVYKRLPNDTDFTVFRRSGMAGLNFAYIDGARDYHTASDNLQSIDERSLQHQGANALALARHFGNARLEPIKEGNAVYFDLLSSTVVHYSYAWVFPLTFAIVLLFAAVVLLGVKRRRLTLSKAGLSAIAFLLNLVLVFSVVSATWWLMRAFNLTAPSLSTNGSRLLLAGFVSLTIALTSAVYVLLNERVGMENFWAGAMVWWALLLVLSSIYARGVSYLFTWPLLFAVVALGLSLVSKEAGPRPIKQFVVASAGAIAAILLVSPLIYLLFIGLTASGAAQVMIMVALLLGLLAPQLQFMTAAKRWALPVLAGFVSIGFIIGGSIASLTGNQPKPDNLFYALNADRGTAVWASVDEAPDEWTSQFLSKEAKRENINEYLPLFPVKVLTSPAETAQLPAPDVVLLNESNENGVRRLSLRITSPRRAGVIAVFVYPETEVQQALVNNKVLETESRAGKSWGLRYVGAPPEGVELTMQIPAAQPMKLRVMDQSYGLPQFANFSFAERPPHLVPGQFPLSDSTTVIKSFTF